MLHFVFKIPFEAVLSRVEIDEYMAPLKLTVNRSDDWDSQVAFRLIGGTGALRLFRVDDMEVDCAAPERKAAYEFHGTAIDGDDQYSVSQLYNQCRKVLNSVAQFVDVKGLIEPPGYTIGNPD